MNYNISLIYSRNPKERIPLLINFLYEYGILQKKKVYLQTFNLNSSYYINRLVSLISKIDFKIVENYMFSHESKNNKLTDKRIISAIKTIRKSKITINCSKTVKNITYLNYLFDLSSINSYQIIIIDNFDMFLKECNNDINKAKETIQKYSKKYKTMIILFTGNETLKKHFLNWQFAKIDDPLEFIYDETNYNIIDIVRKDIKNEREN